MTKNGIAENTSTYLGSPSEETIYVPESSQIK